MGRLDPRPSDSYFVAMLQQFSVSGLELSVPQSALRRRSGFVGVWVYSLIVCAVVGVIVWSFSGSLLALLPVFAVWLLCGLVGTLILALHTIDERDQLASSEINAQGAPLAEPLILSGFAQITATRIVSGAESADKVSK